MTLISVDRTKCILCSACQDVCPSKIIAIDSVNGPQKVGTRTCIACGHCVAVCPTRALDNRKSLLSEHTAIGDWKLPSSEEVAKIIRFRRSIRNYKQELVEEKEIEKVLDLARYAPTGINTQGISFLVFSDKDKLDKIRESVITWMESVIEADEPRASYFSGVVESYRKEQNDTILRGAPHLVVAIAAKTHMSAEQNCSFVWSYAELLAPSLGLGTCIAGYIQGCILNGWQPLLDIFELPKNMKAISGLMLGRPKYRYKSLVPRQKLNIAFR